MSFDTISNSQLSLDKLSQESTHGNIAIRIEKINKCYQIYDIPRNRLKQFFFPRFQKLIGKKPKEYYREFWALKNVSFNVKKGETVGIVGKNGSGKSTLLQIICGTLTQTSGSVETCGRIAALLELGSGFNPDFSGRENVYLNGAILGLSQSEIHEKMESILAFADIGEFIDQPVKTYSSGMYVRLAFAIQANIDPDILIIDEALAVGDAQFVHRCMARIHELKKRKTTILIVTHDASTVKRLCDRAIWLKTGHIFAIGKSNKVVDAYLKDLFDLCNYKNKNYECKKVNIPKKAILRCPKGDERIGRRRLEFVSVSLFNANSQPAKSISWNENFKIIFEIKNNSMERFTDFNCGYILRDPKGIEIAATNALMEGIELKTPVKGKIATIVIDIEIPMLQPGYYSITPSVSSINANRQFVIEDRIINALLLEITTSQQIFTPFRLPTRFQIL